jgi:hypothetical protein
MSPRAQLDVITKSTSDSTSTRIDHGARRRMDQGRTGEGARIVVGVRTSLALLHHAAAFTSLSAPDPTLSQLDSKGVRAERPRKGETERGEGEGEGWGPEG